MTNCKQTTLDDADWLDKPDAAHHSTFVLINYT